MWTAIVLGLHKVPSYKLCNYLSIKINYVYLHLYISLMSHDRDLIHGKTIPISYSTRVFSNLYDTRLFELC